tara:strand:- start:238 stop:915 length:678 start_codon:yes stop_codon:yes gene_type:complete
MQTIKFKDGKLKVDSFTASGIMAVYDKVNPKNKKSIENIINSGTKAQIMKLQSLAMKATKKEEVDEHKGTKPHKHPHEDEVDEGTWGAASTPKEKNQLKKYLSKPFKAKDFEKLYNLIGDDGAFDDFGEYAKKNPNADLRPMMRDWMYELGIFIKEETLVEVDQLPQRINMMKKLGLWGLDIFNDKGKKPDPEEVKRNIRKKMARLKEETILDRIDRKLKERKNG